MAKEANGQFIIQLFEQFSPKKYAMEGDKIGLQIGTLSKPVKRVMIALDVLEEVVDEAIEKNVDLIIAHHPPIFRPLKNIVTDKAQGRIVEKCIKHDIAVYAAHTNLDVAVGGVNDLLAEKLQLMNTKVLIPTYHELVKKLVVFVPENYADQVREAIGQAGAGFIGNYSHCTFNTEGTGTFKPQEGTNPFIGEKGKLEKVDEVRIESVFPASIQGKVMKAMIQAHPYEEVAYDIYSLDNEGEVLGLGRIGELKEQMSLKQFAEHVKTCFQVDSVRVVGSLTDKVKKVAIVGGDGNKYIHQAKMSGADVYVTGDIYYHVAHDAMMLGLNMVDPGHHVEKVMKEGVTEKLKHICEKEGLNVTIFPSEPSTDPFTFV
ncbi:Nif3-like dinuclear metal center hexameric protein [Bacillus sp. FJAT-47783]|uniref:Nif3-like dinuclear metal center hexameric protein n=1 Tax=Bacillus sp. FJAT-47783 TaxID=2922712 RepID=UPI001FAC5AD7|nr:Nif3-like dinuclear metal center hexameric protein [Bacillus sp. FJAT-47783]